MTALPPPMIASPTEPERFVRILNSLLRAEITATETYSQAIPRISNDVEVLREIAREHGQAVSDLREAIQRLGGVPDETSGIFPAMPSKPVFGPAHVFGEAVALQALKEVEERGLGEYEDALKRLDGEESGWISGKSIPAQMKHISSIEEIIAQL